MGVLSIFLNTSCIFVLHHTPELDPITKTFLTSLNIADLGLCLFFIAPSAGTALTGHWPFGDFLCIAQVITMQPCIFVVVLSVVAINVERYIAICYPLHYPRWITLTRARWCVVSFWVIGVFIIIMCGVESHWRICYLDDHQMCFFVPDAAMSWIVWYALSIALLCIGILAILILYIKIIWIVHERTISIRIAGQERRFVKKDRKAATTFFLLTISLVIGYLPYLVVSYLEGIGQEITIELILYARLALASNGWWDVLIYYGRNRVLRRTMKQLLRDKCCKIQAPILAERSSDRDSSST